ncbi:Lam5 protein [Saccharomycopsis crataegensis]|uniref:Lam5 protein n=1 Tax=Saccharomycopsis crataegensis TaxID=43959 RepID=A0AAV5QLC3_9ASCO|nr:Lam5 protein [Saccharomycopsis crataegensis]
MNEEEDLGDLGNNLEKPPKIYSSPINKDGLSSESIDLLANNESLIVNDTKPIEIKQSSGQSSSNQDEGSDSSTSNIPFNGINTASSISLGNSMLKGQPANPATTLAKGESSSGTESSSPLERKGHKRAQASFNDNLKEIGKSLAGNDLKKKSSIAALRDVQSRNDAAENTNADDAEFTGQESSPNRNSGFFTSVWSTATNSLRTPKAPQYDEEDLGLNVRKVRNEEDEPTTTNDNSPKIISYRKRSRKISTSSTSNVPPPEPIETSNLNAIPSSNSTEESEMVNADIDDQLANKSPSFNAKLYSEETAYETKYHYAIEARNNDFHILFKSVLPDERLIDDFSCALSREILLQGRLYVSDRNLCFNSNILGWVTNLIISFSDITSFEKTSTAGLFPNGIAITTRTAKHNLATFLSRDSTYEFLNTIWLNYIQLHPADAPVDSKPHNDLIEEGPEFNPEEEQEITTKELANTNSGQVSRSSSQASSKSNDSFLDFRKNVGIITNNDLFLRSIHNNDNHMKNYKGLENNLAEEPLAGSDQQSLEDQVLSIDGDEDTGENQVEDEEECEDDDEDDDEEYEDEDEQDNDEGDDNEVSTGKVQKDQVSSQKEISSETGTSTQTTHKETGFLMDPATNDEIVLIEQEVIDATLPQVFDLLFGEDNSFQLKYIEASDGSKITPIVPHKHLSADEVTDANFKPHVRNDKLQRYYSYTKALNYAIGPKSTTCKIIETIEEKDFDKGFNIVLKTLTPEVPSGSAFTVDTRYLAAWGPNNKTKIKISYRMIWTGSSWVKGIIEKSTKSGQVDASAELIKLIKQEVSGFVEKNSGTVSLKLGGAAEAATGEAMETKEKAAGLENERKPETTVAYEISEEIEEIEKTLWDILQTNWVLVVVFSALGAMLFFQLRMYQMLQENNRIQTEQLRILGEMGGRNSIFSEVGQKGRRDILNRMRIEKETASNVWKWLDDKTHKDDVIKDKEGSTEEADSTANSFKEPKIDENNTIELRKELDTIFKKLFEDVSVNSESSRKYYAEKISEKLSSFLDDRDEKSEDKGNNKDYFFSMHDHGPVEIMEALSQIL